ncbi:hypothetical protein AAFF_G00246810 [Aldrovandia affinis]|uniref:Uncharacterized protein n=1 Tax=Aldrovandia affinis TaxID=143900 RepID=A0AAD7SUE5_9TELE|nr:hypothetical protein AAFF_G00246810 [Aldrovandia affinis]
MSTDRVQRSLLLHFHGDAHVGVADGVPILLDPGDGARPCALGGRMADDLMPLLRRILQQVHYLHQVPAG